MPSPVPYREIKQLIEQHGYVLRRVAGSHHIFEGPLKPRSLWGEAGRGETEECQKFSDKHPLCHVDTRPSPNPSL